MRLLRFFSIISVVAGCMPDDPNCAVLNQVSDEHLTSETDFFKNSMGPENINVLEDGSIRLKIQQRFDNPTVTSKFYIHHGKVEADIKGASGQGIVLAMYLQSDDLDEIDVEMFGGNPFEFQLNFFVKGSTKTYDRGGYHGVDDPIGKFHRYGIEWTPDKITFELDGHVVRTIDKLHPQGFPLSPMAVKFSLWAGGDESNEPGTIAWAGGSTDYTAGPFSMAVRRVRVVDYSRQAPVEKKSDQDDRWFIQFTSTSGAAHKSSWLAGIAAILM